MAQDLLLELRRRGIVLRLRDDRVDVLAPAGSLTPELRTELRLRQAELRDLLRTAAGAAGDGTAAPVTPRPDQRHEPFPLTDIQHAYWVGRNPAVELGGVDTHFYFELDGGPLDPARLTHSLRRVIDRHDMLRAVIGPDGTQRILPDVPGYEIPVADLSALPAPGREDALRATREAMSARAPDPERWPLLAVRLSLLGGGRTRLHVSAVMLVLDAYSLALLFQDWHRFYADPQWTPEPLPLSFRDVVQAGGELRDSGRYRAAERYWLDRLDTLPPAPGLPLRQQPARLGRPRFTTRAARLPADRFERIGRYARERDLTPSTVLLCAYADVLRTWSGQPSFTLNLTLFDRPPVHPAVDSLIGDFTSLVLLAVDAPPDAPFAGRAAHLQRQLMRDLEHTAYGGVRLLRERARRLGTRAEAGMPVVFTSTVGLRGGGGPGTGRDFFGRLVYSTSQTPQVWLDHQVSPDPDGLRYNWDAVEDLFPGGLLDDAFAAYRDALERLAGDPGAWDGHGAVVSLPGWQARERARANATAAPLPARTLDGLVEEQVRRRPEAPAVLAADGVLSYREVGHAARRLARHLTGLGVAPGDLVGVLLPAGWRQVPAVLGVVAARAAYLPVDPAWPPARRAEVLRQGGVRVVVTAAPLRAELAALPDLTVVTLEDPGVREASPEPLPAGPVPEDLAYVIFTSGSTGRPKGVTIDHRAAANTVQSINALFRIGADDRVLALSSLTFDLSVYDIFGALAAGAAVVLPEAGRTRDPAHWTELVDRHRVSVWNSVPALMRTWLDWLGEHGTVPAGPRLAMLSGDTVPVSLPAAVRAVLPEVELVSLGGATEASIWSVYHPIGEVPPTWSRIPYGRPLPNQTLHVYDEGFRPCPVWTPGELYIGGAGVARGYWGDAQRTAERFVHHPVTGQRLYRTGDVCRYLPGGDLEFLGRVDHQVKINGYRVELGEIASALRRQPGVAEVVVDAATNPATGRRQLVAYLVPDRRTTTRAPHGDEVWPALAPAAAGELRRGAGELAGELEIFEHWWSVVERACPAVMAGTLARLGEFSAAGQSATAAGIVERRDLKPGYTGLVEQWLSVLAAEGYLRPDGRPGGYRCERALDGARLDREVRDALAGLSLRGSHEAFVDYLSACAGRQIELLRGEVSPLELLLPGGDARVTAALYADNPANRLLNRAAAAAVRAAAQRVAAHRPVRVCEVGGGTGATAAQVLPELAGLPVRYRFTDVSRYFVEPAATRFADHPFVEYGLFDVDREPAGQGVPAGSVDVLVAANVLHDAADLAASLRYLRSVLAPGGVAVLIEGTANSYIQMISVGFIEGFGNHEGQRTLPLLPVPQWREQLTAAGFTRFAAVPQDGPVTTAMPQHLLLAQAPPGESTVDTAGLRAALEQTLPGYLVPHHYVVLDRLPLTVNGKVDRAALPRPWDSAAPAAPVAPRDDLEGRLLAVWREALAREDFGVEDNFFELGGDSLHAVRILGRLREEFGLTQTADEGLRTLLQSPTVAGQAAALRGTGAAS
jgi:pyochelin synthetase